MAEAPFQSSCCPLSPSFASQIEPCENTWRFLNEVYDTSSSPPVRASGPVSSTLACAAPGNAWRFLNEIYDTARMHVSAPLAPPAPPSVRAGQARSRERKRGTRYSDDDLAILAIENPGKYRRILANREVS